MAQRPPAEVGREEGDRARRRRHDSHNVELRAVQQLDLQCRHERKLRRPDRPTRARPANVPSPATCSRPRPGMVDLVNQAKASGTPSSSSRGVATRSMPRRSPTSLNDTAAGFSEHRRRSPTRGTTVPEIDAGYAAPTPINTGHPLARSLHRWSVHEAGYGHGDDAEPVPRIPEQARVLRRGDREQRVLPDDPLQVGHPRVHRVAGLRHRRQLRRPVQRSRDGFADKTFKMPNPNYYLP